jgi:phage repressor protein C with HTH and peptisase S24 domain
MIEVVTEKAFAGYLNGYSDPEYIGDLERMKLPFRVVGKHRAFPVRGDSMPPLKEGSFVIGKFLESPAEIKDGLTYVLVTREDGIVYKRVRKKGRLLELSSDNSGYSPYEVRPDDVLEAWKFVCALNTSDTKEEDLNLESIMTMLRDMKVEMEMRRKK